jgi:hypothetical protein
MIAVAITAAMIVPIPCARRDTRTASAAAAAMPVHAARPVRSVTRMPTVAPRPAPSLVDALL